ncbi:hypothetical protein JT358_00740 [Micrococcales bacterium 31B]|nr:hypothetical protein [Micrococcales bacterium 31B]
MLLPLTPEGLDDQKVGYAHPEGNYVTSLVYSFRPTFAAASSAKRPRRTSTF